MVSLPDTHSCYNLSLATWDVCTVTAKPFLSFLFPESKMLTQQICKSPAKNSLVTTEEYMGWNTRLLISLQCWVLITLLGINLPEYMFEETDASKRPISLYCFKAQLSFSPSLQEKSCLEELCVPEASHRTLMIERVQECNLLFLECPENWMCSWQIIIM